MFAHADAQTPPHARSSMQIGEMSANHFIAPPSTADAPPHDGSMVDHPAGPTARAPPRERVRRPPTAPNKHSRQDVRAAALHGRFVNVPQLRADVALAAQCSYDIAAKRRSDLDLWDLMHDHEFYFERSYTCFIMSDEEFLDFLKDDEHTLIHCVFSKQAVIEKHIRENAAATTIQRTWRCCRWDPAFRMCHKVQLTSLYALVGENGRFPGLGDHIRHLRL
jgi:hypothetical protein